MMHISLSLARRLELTQAWRGIHYLEAWQKLHPDRRIQIQPFGGGYALYGWPGSPLNRAVGLGMESQVTLADIAAVEQFFHEQGEPGRIDLCPLAGSALIEILQDRGYHLEMFYNVLACPLPVEIRSDPGIRVTRAALQEADLWIQTTARGFGEEDPSGMQGPNFYSANGFCYFAWAGDEPAGGGGMYMHERAVELGGASTLPEFRRRGVQTALLGRRLSDAAQMGCDLAVVLTEPGSPSQRNIERAGFQLAYTKPVMIREQ